MTERILITGATGFVGSALHQHLISQDKQITVITRPGSTRTSLPSVNITWTGDTARLIQQVAEVQPDVVFHLATNFIAHHETSDIPELIDSNVTFGTAVLEASWKSGARVVITGTHWQHVEGAVYHPVSLYAATKRALLDIAVFYVHEGLDVRELTLFDTYGPNDPRRKLVPLLLEAAATGASLPMSSGDQLIDLLYVTDVIAALIQAAQQPVSDTQSVQQFVARSGEPVTIRQLVETVQQAINKVIRVEWEARPNRPNEMMRNWMVGQALPEWEPTVPLFEGLSHCWGSVR